MKVKVCNLTRRYGAHLAVKNISFNIGAGQVIGFVGPNGAGKTTTMRVMATLDEPTSGDVRIDGVSVVEQPEEARRRIGFMPDQLPNHRDITIHEYLDFFARAYGLHDDNRQQTVAAVESFTGVDGFREKCLNQLSKGMKQRVSLARALVHDPDLLIMDEPAAGLDPKARVQLRELIDTLAESGKSIFISSHILDELGELCDGVVIIEQGQLIHHGAINAIAGQDGNGIRTVWVRSLGDLDQLQRALLESPGILDVDVLKDEVRARFSGLDQDAATLLASLVQRGVPVVEFRHHREDLEDIFMKVTAGKLA